MTNTTRFRSTSPSLSSYKSIVDFIESKRQPELHDCYLNYSKLNEELEVVSRLESEKSYRIDFTILSPQETESGKYKVLPVISNQKFMDSYLQFLTKLQDEIHRTDEAILNRINIITHQLDQAKVLPSPATSTSWFSRITLWIFSPSLTSPESQLFLTRLSELEAQLLLIRKNVVALNKFALSKLLEAKQDYLESSQFRHLLLQVELGVEVPAPSSPFPIKGQCNRHQFSTQAPPAIEIMAPSRVPSLSHGSSLNSPHSELPSSTTKPDPLTILTPPKPDQLKVLIPPKPDLHPSSRTISSLKLSRSPSPTFRPEFVGLNPTHNTSSGNNSAGVSSSSSSILSHASSSCSSRYGRLELAHSAQFWCQTPRHLKSLLDEIKALRRQVTSSHLHTRLRTELPV